MHFCIVTHAEEERKGFLIYYYLAKFNNNNAGRLVFSVQTKKVSLVNDLVSVGGAIVSHTSHKAKGDSNLVPPSLKPDVAKQMLNKISLMWHGSTTVVVARNVS